jgi:thioredoxin-like negative regulator of GroEL
MEPLLSQDQFEQLIGRAPTEAKIPSEIVVYFTAGWCGPCKRINYDEIIGAKKGVHWFKCDVDQNSYTHGFCGLRSIPSFVAIKDMKVVSSLSSSDNGKIVEWVNQTFP